MHYHISSTKVICSLKVDVRISLRVFFPYKTMLLDSNTKTKGRVKNNELISTPIRFFFPYFSFFHVYAYAGVVLDWKFCSYLGCPKYSPNRVPTSLLECSQWSKPYLLKPESRVRLIKWWMVGDLIHLYASIPSTYINRTQLMIVLKNCMLL